MTTKYKKLLKIII